MKAIILAAGAGTRMRGFCHTLPKPMLPIANRPIIATTITRLGALGVDQVGVVVGHQGDRLRQLLGSGAQLGVEISYIWQHEKLGTGHAVSLCEDFVAGEPFALMWGDVMTHGENYARIAERYDQGDCDAVLAVFRVADACRTAAVDVADGWVTGITERPAPGTRLNAYANAGIFIWPAAMLEVVRRLERSPRGEIEFTDGIAEFVASGSRVAALELNGYRENITDPEACVRVNRLLMTEMIAPLTSEVAASARMADDVSLCEVEVQETATIGERCVLGPQVSVGEGACIGAGCRIGPNVAIGPGCVVGDGTALRESLLLPEATLGENVSLEYAMVDAGAKVPAGTSLAGSAEAVCDIIAP
jgi:glucose-1-phosphate thymidylyltransferase